MSEAHSGGRRLINATAVMASGTMVSRVLGLLRAVLIAFVLGNVTLSVNTFTLAMIVPNSLYILLAGGTLNNVLVPQIVRAVTHDADAGKAFVDRIMTGFLIVLGALTVVFTIATPLVMSIYTQASWRSPEMAGAWRSLLLMSYLTMPQIFFYGVFFLIGQVLNAREKFGPMMWAPILNNVVSIGVFGVYLWIWGTQPPGEGFTDSQVWLLGVGSTFGIAAQTLVLLPYLRRVGFSYRPRFDLKGTGLGRTFHVAKWMVGYVSLTSLAQVVVTNLASGGGPDGGAAVNAYQNAYLIWILPHSLLTVSLATAMLPAASRFAVAGDHAGVAAEANRALRLACTFLLPAGAGLAVLADPVTRLVFGNGSGAADYHFVAWALVAFAVGLVPFTIQYLYLRAFYALDNTRTPFLLQIWISGANAALAVALVLAWDDPGTVAARLALAYSLAYLLGVFLTHRALRKRLPELDGRQTWQHLVRLLLATVPAAVIAWVVTWWFSQYPSTLLRAIGLALAALAAVLAFFFTAKRLGIPEASMLLDVVRRRRPDSTPAAQDDDQPGPPQPNPAKEDHRQPAETVNPDPDGTGVFVQVAAPSGPPAEVLEFPEPTAPAVEGGGRVLGRRYQLEEQLAVRDRTETWRAHDTVLGRPVLVHLLPAADPRTAEVLRLAREAALATDSRFLRVLDVVAAEPGAGAYLVYEYAAGQTLEKVLGDGPLTGVETAWIVREVADGLIGLHAQGHYHRRLNPATLLVTASGNVKVLGFGVNEDGGTSAHLNGEAADVQSLGQLLYACLVGRWPGGDRFGLPAAPTADGRLLLPGEVRGGVPPAVESVVDRILSPTPRGHASRLATAQEVTTQLSLVLGPMSAAHDLKSRLHPVDGETSLPAPVSRVAPPVPVPAASRYHASVQLDPEEAPGEETAPFVDEALQRGESFTPVPPPPAAPGSPPEQPEVGPQRRLPFLLGAVVLVLVVGVVAAVVLANRPAPEPAAATTRQLEVAEVSDFDPRADGGSGGENGKQSGLATDGNADTAWRTERYRTLPNLGGLKPGVGLVLDLGRARTVTRVDVTLAGEGTDVELRVPARQRDAAPMRSVKQWTVVTTATEVDRSMTWELPEPVESRYLLVYLTALPAAGDGYFRGGIAEVVVTGR